MTTNEPLNPNVLDPAEIVKLPVRRDLPFNGLTESQVRAIGADPQQVEAARLSNNIWAKQQQRNEDAQLALAAQQAVTEGEMTYPEVAQALLAADRRDAHDAVVQMWREDESWYAEQEAADELAMMGAEQYIEHFNAQQVREHDQLVQQAQETALQLESAKLEQLIDKFKQFVQSTPGAHSIVPDVEKRLVEKIRQDGTTPDTEAEADAMIAAALQESAVLGQATESLRQQVDTEWRFHRKANGARDGLMTAADIASAEAQFKEERFKQLTDSSMVDLESLKPGPTAEEQSAGLVEKYRDKQERSTGFHTQIADIEERGKDATAARDRGEGISEEKSRYREALTRAEAEAQFGSSEIKSGYGPTHEATLGAAAEKITQELDEYGGAFPGFQ